MPNASVPMLVTESGMMTSEKQERLNALLPMVFTFRPSVTEVALFPKNAMLLIVVTESGIVIFLMPMQSEKALDPMVSSDSERRISVSTEQPWQNLLPMDVTVSDMVTEVSAGYS